MNILLPLVYFKEVRRLEEGHHKDRFIYFLAQIRAAYSALYEADIKPSGPLTDESIIVDEDQPKNEKEQST